MSDQLDTVRIFRFNRGHLFLGGERPLVLMTATMTLIMVVMLQDRYAAITGIILWVVLTRIFKLLAKYDPVMSVVYQRYASHPRFYASHGKKKTLSSYERFKRQLLG